jgi:uncharacterized SAM-binding protein YcdF (DUF218 family)/lysophospholipase L1-like esterase
LQTQGSGCGAETGGKTTQSIPSRSTVGFVESRTSLAVPEDRRRPPVLVRLAGAIARRRPRRFATGVLYGVLAAIAARYVINHTPIADYLVAPLIHADTPGRGDAIVVLGAGTSGPCELNLYAIQRVRLAARLWHEGRAPLMLITGGVGWGTSCAVASAMADFAMQLGVPRSALILETSSQNTHENAARTAPLLRAAGAQRVILVTDRLHMTRAAAAFAHEGFVVGRASVPVYATHPDNMSMLAGGAREAVAIAYYRWRGWVGDGPAAAAPGGEPDSGRAAAAMSEQQTPRQVVPARAEGPIVILGASYAAGWHPPDGDGLRFVNKGISGQESWQLLDRFDRDVAALSPRAVIIWGFINDIHRAPPDKQAAAVERARVSISTMVKKARVAGIEPILTTELTIRPVDTWGEWASGWVGWLLRKEGYQDRINRQVIGTNAWLKDFAGREGLLVLDVYPLLSEPTGERRKQFAKPDGSHIPPAGYEVLTRELLGPLRARLARP